MNIYRIVITEPEATNCFSIIYFSIEKVLLKKTNTRVYFMNIICINNLLPSDFQPFWGVMLYKL